MNINILAPDQESAPRIASQTGGGWRRAWKYGLSGVFLPLVAAAVALLAVQNRTLEYESEAALVVTFGEEYIARPIAADSESWAPWSDQVAVNSELAILNSETLRDRVIQRIGIEEILGRDGSPPERSQHLPLLSDLRTLIKHHALEWDLLQPGDDVEEARRTWERDLNVKGTKDSSVVYVTYRHPSPETAKAIVDTIVAVYFDMRRSIYAKPGNNYSDSQLVLRRTQYEQAVRDIKDFEATEGGGNFTAIVDRAVEEASSLESVVAGLDRGLAGQLGALAAREIAGTSTGASLSDALVSNASITALRAERDEAAEQLRVARDRLKMLANKSVEYAVLNEGMESAREAYRKALELSWQAEVDSVLDRMQFSNVKILQSGSLPRAPINLPVATVVSLSAVLALVAVLIIALLFSGRSTAVRRSTA